MRCIVGGVGGPLGYAIICRRRSDRERHNLDLKNPNANERFEHMPPERLVDYILAKERRITEIIAEIKALLETTT